jgi:hypothetical protein
MALGILGIALSLHAQTFTCIRIRMPDHDWTYRVGSYQFGLQGYGSRTEVCYGHKTRSIPLPFQGAVALFGVAFAALCAGGFLIVRRR